MRLYNIEGLSGTFVSMSLGYCFLALVVHRLSQYVVDAGTEI